MQGEKIGRGVGGEVKVKICVRLSSGALRLRRVLMSKMAELCVSSKGRDDRY